MSEQAVFRLYTFWMLLGVFISSAAQVLLKKAAQKKYASIIKEYLNPWVISAYAIFFGATLLTILSYKVVPLSLGGILEATGYIYITFFGLTIFHEKWNKRKALALVLIVAGIVVYSVFG